jgi:hypothetical protein
MLRRRFRFDWLSDSTDFAKERESEVEREESQLGALFGRRAGTAFCIHTFECKTSILFLADMVP